MVNALTALGEGLLVSGSLDNTIKLWKLPPQLQLTKVDVVSAPAIVGAAATSSRHVLEHKADAKVLSPATSTAALPVLSSSQEAVLTQLASLQQDLARQQHRIATYEGELAILSSQRTITDEKVFAQLQGRAAEVQRLLAKEKADYQAEQERQAILAQDKLSDLCVS